MGEQAGKWEDATNVALLTILQPSIWLFLKVMWLGQSISNEIQQGLTSRRVGLIPPPDSSEEESTEVKGSVSIPSCY
jgi:hypothetical protein